MNANIKTSLIAMLATMAMGACVSERDGVDSGVADDNLIRVFPQVNQLTTRTGWNTTTLAQENRQFGLFVVPQSETPQPESSYYNVRMVYKNSVWNDYAPDDSDAATPLRQMHWGNREWNIRATAYMPYRAEVSSLTTLTGKIGTEQGANEQGESVTANDYLYFNGVVNPTATADRGDAYGNIVEYALVDGKLAIPFRHAAAKLNLILRIGTSFNLTSPGTATNPISGLKIDGTVCDYNFDLATGVLGKSVATAASSVTPWFDAGAYLPGESYLRKAVASYECILVPQTVAANAFSVSLTIGGKAYEWVSEAPVTLMSGKQHHLTLNVGENTISLTDFTIDEWGTTDVPVGPDVASPVAIDETLSTIGDDVDLFAADNRLHFTNDGGAATLVLTGDYDKEYEIIDADPRLTIVAETGTFKNSSFKITATQIVEGDAYSARLQVANPLLAVGGITEITIDVDANRIPSVEMAGLEWMAFNGVGRDPFLYIHHSRKTIREIYAQDWKKYTGMCIWGPRKVDTPMLYPWEVVLANYNGEAMQATTPDWTSEHTNIPCPAGWRVPTFDEFARIWPANGMSIPATYLRGNDQYSASIIPSGATAIPVEGNSSIATNLFVISDGKNELLFPMAGWRQRKDYAGNKSLMAVGAGKAFYLWTQNHGPLAWNVRVVGVNANSTGYYNADNSEQAMGEAFQSVRCVKIK